MELSTEKKKCKLRSGSRGIYGLIMGPKKIKKYGPSISVLHVGVAAAPPCYIFRSQPIHRAATLSVRADSRKSRK